MEPRDVELDGAVVAVVAREDQDLLSRDAQEGIQRIADPMGFFFALALLLWAFQRQGGIARGFIIGAGGLLVGATRIRHRVSPLETACVQQVGVRGGYVDDIRETYEVRDEEG